MTEPKPGRSPSSFVYTDAERAALEAEHVACYADPIYDGGEPRHDWTWHDERVAAPARTQADASGGSAGLPMTDPKTPYQAQSEVASVAWPLVGELTCLATFDSGRQRCVKPLYRASNGEVWEHGGGHFFTTAEAAHRLATGDYDARVVLESLVRVVPDDVPCRRGEFVYGLGWSCVTHDTFGCPDAQPSAKPGEQS